MQSRDLTEFWLLFFSDFSFTPLSYQLVGPSIDEKTKYISFVLLFMSYTDVVTHQVSQNVIRTHVMHTIESVSHMYICVRFDVVQCVRCVFVCECGFGDCSPFAYAFIILHITNHRMHRQRRECFPFRSISG